MHVFYALLHVPFLVGIVVNLDRFVILKYDKYNQRICLVKLLYDKIVVRFIDICLVTKEELKKKIGQRIIQLRMQKGWNQSDLARACNKDRQAMEKLENGKVNPTLYSLLEVSEALGVPISVLVNF